MQSYPGPSDGDLGYRGSGRFLKRVWSFDLSQEDSDQHSQRTERAGRDGGCVGPGPVRGDLPRQRSGAHRGARDPVGRRARHRQDVGGGGEGVGEGVLLLGGEQRDVRGHPAEAEHGDPRCGGVGEGEPRAGGAVHVEHVEEARATRGARHHGESRAIAVNLACVERPVESVGLSRAWCVWGSSCRAGNRRWRRR